MVIRLGREALYTVLLVAGPVVGLSLLTGLVVSIFQAVTQINEATLAFVPKIIAALAAAILFGPWMYTTLIEYTLRLYRSIPDLAR